MQSDLLTWGPRRLAQLLPLDDESLKQIITYSASLSKEASAEHLKNLLGDSPAALEFIASFNSRRDSSVTSTDRKDNNGNSGRARNSRQDAGGDGVSNGPTTTQSSRGNNGQASPATSSKPTASKTPSGATGSLISDFLPNVKSKSAKSSSSRQATSRTASPSSAKNNKNPGSNTNSVTTNNLADLTSAIAALEMSTNPTLGQGKRRKCNCYASIHPLFAPAPNCLNCGKIICSLEGLQPCSFCGTPLLSSDEVQGMIRELRAERGQEKMRVHNEGVRHDGGPGLSSGPGPSSLSSSSSPATGDSNLDAAKAHRDRLLQYQAQNARRTRIVDEAADFETPNVASTIWMSPAQRALALKKQQRVMREMEEKARPEWEKKKTVMSLDIKGGKVSRVYHSAAASPAESSPEEEDDEEEEKAMEEEKRRANESSQHDRGRAFSNNPLLASGGLLRPVWKAPEGKHVDGAAGKEKKQTWRRVQDDRDDNEQWILDGGLHGYTS